MSEFVIDADDFLALLSYEEKKGIIDELLEDEDLVDYIKEDVTEPDVENPCTSEEKEQITEPDAENPSTFHIGEKVIAVDNSFGWGGVKCGDQGVIVNIWEEGDFSVDFENHCDWRCKEKDLKPVTSECDDLMTIEKDEVTLKGTPEQLAKLSILSEGQ